MLNVDLMIEDDQLSEDCLQCLLAVRSSIEEASMLIMKFQQEKALGNRE